MSSVLDEGDEQQPQPWQQQGHGYLPNGSTRRTPRPAVALPVLPRQVAATPRPVPIIHSSAYQQALVQTRTMSPGVMVNSDDEDDFPAQPALYSRATPRPSTNSNSSSSAPSTAVVAVAAAPAAPPAPTTGTMSVRVAKRTVTRPGAAGSPEPFQGSALEWALHKADASLDELEENPMPLQKAVYDISRGPVGTATSSAVQAAAKLTMKGAVEVAKVAAPVAKWALQEGAKAAAGLITRAFIESVTPQGSRKNNNSSSNNSSKDKDGGNGGNRGINIGGLSLGGGTGTTVLKRRSPAPPPPQPSRQQQQQPARKGGKPR